MARLEELIAGAQVAGILPDASVSVVTVQWFGSDALELTYKDPAGRVANQLLYRHDESRLKIVIATARVLQAELGRKPKPTEIAARAGLDQEQVRHALALA